MRGKIFAILIISLFLLFGCITTPTRTETINDDNSDLSKEINEIINTIDDVTPKLSYVGDTGISYKFDSSECSTTTSYQKCMDCNIDIYKKTTNVYVDYTNTYETNQGFFIKIIYGPDNNVVIGDPQGFTVGQTRRLTAATDPLDFRGCLNTITAEVHLFATKELLETITITSSD